jgi:hypothetical protein
MGRPATHISLVRPNRPIERGADENKRTGNARPRDRSPKQRTRALIFTAFRHPRLQWRTERFRTGLGCTLVKAKQNYCQLRRRLGRWGQFVRHPWTSSVVKTHKATGPF